MLTLIHSAAVLTCCSLDEDVVDLRLELGVRITSKSKTFFFNLALWRGKFWIVLSNCENQLVNMTHFKVVTDDMKKRI
jgi:hypothetical protein